MSLSRDMRIRPTSAWSCLACGSTTSWAIGRRSILRMDAEGSEPLVLKGAEALMRRSPQLRIVMEFAPTMMATRVDVPTFVGWLESLGFRAWRIGPSGAPAALAMAALPSAPHCEIVLSRDVPP